MPVTVGTPFGQVGVPIRGKGTPFKDVYNRVPKYFYGYGSQTAPTDPRLFYIENGRHVVTMDEALNYLREKGAYDAEKAARKSGERVTLDPALFTSWKASSDWKGVVQIGGRDYDANIKGAPEAMPPARTPDGVGGGIGAPYIPGRGVVPEAVAIGEKPKWFGLDPIIVIILAVAIYLVAFQK